MPEAADAITSALDELERAKRMLQRDKAKQVRNIDERRLLKALALTWFGTRRPVLLPAVQADALSGADAVYREVLDATDRLAARTTYLAGLRQAKNALIELRAVVLAAPPTLATTSDVAPDFTSLASDSLMRDILKHRWEECIKCLNASAYLAATVMMGGLLEALLVARANQMPDKSPLFKTKATPVDPRTQKPLDLRQWTLAPYIDVAHELRWIARSAKDVAGVLRDYRNYVHPEKQRSHGVILEAGDAMMFWEVVKELARQLLASTK